MVENILQYIIPSGIGAASAFGGMWLNSRIQNRKVNNDYDAALRESLMIERKQLVTEIDGLKRRCDALELTNIKQAKEMLDLQEKNHKLVLEIKHFGSDLPDE